MRSAGFAVALSMFAGPVLAQAQHALPDWVSRVTIGGVAYLNYQYEMTDGAPASRNAFSVTRMYLFANIRPAEHVRFRLTFDTPNREFAVSTRAGGDTTSVTSEAGKFDVVLKHAYLELSDISTRGLSLRFGMADLPFVGYEERIWTYRFQGPVFADREGYLSSTDLGLGMSYVLSNRVLEGHVNLVNGETWSKPELDRHKDVHARLTLRPLAARVTLQGLSLSLIGTAGQYRSGDDQTRRRVIAQAAFEHRFGAIAADYFRASDPPSQMRARQPSLANSTDAVVTARGYSVFGWLDLGLFNLPRGLRLMGRIEHLDPDVNLDENGHTRTIFGIGYRLNDYVHVLLDGESVSYQANAGARAGSPPTDESRAFLHIQVGF